MLTAGSHYYEVHWRDGTSIGAPMQRDKFDDYALAFEAYAGHSLNSWHTAIALVRIEEILGMEQR